MQRPSADAPGVPVLWRKRVLVDAATRRPIVVPPRESGVPFVALDPGDEGRAQLEPALAARGEFVDPTFELGRYDAGERATVVRALATARWAESARFCDRCGRALRWETGTLARTCDDPAGPHRHFPRLDPAVIVLVDDGERMLLGRQPGWPAGLYSTLAGFVEAGESVEETVAREVFEEAGVRLSRVRYFGSESWPFPRSLMLGFFATATTTALARGDELEDVRWFDVAEGRRLRDAMERAMPAADTIARRLIAAWLAARE